MNYRPDLDGLRCLAVALVVVFHFELLPLMDAGFIGVDIFFVISGYLITSIIWGGLEQGRFSVKHFYLRRFRRLAPVLFGVQALLLIVGSLLLLPFELADLAEQTIATQLYVVNVYLWRTVNYFGLQSEGVYLLHCWSLAIEEQFYLLYPWVLLGIHRWARRAVVALLASLALGSFALNLALVESKPEAVFYLLPTRAWELLLGGLLPWGQPWFLASKARREAAAWLGVTLIAAAFVYYTPSVEFPGVFALLPTLGAAGLILSGVGDASSLSRALSLSPFVYVGKLSYSLYLVHWPLRVLIGGFVVDYHWGWRTTSLLLSLALSVAFYHALEAPLRRGVRLANPRRFLVAYAGSSAALVLTAALIVRSGGWRERFDKEALRLADFATDVDAAGRRCEVETSREQSQACILGAPGVTPSWIILGDSHAWALGQAFSLYFERRGLAGKLMFRQSCMPLDEIGSAECRRYTAKMRDVVTHDPALSTVVLVSTWRQVLEPGLQDATGHALDADERIDAFQKQFASTITRWRAAGKDVVVWEPLPTAKLSVPVALARAHSLGWHADFRMRTDEYERDFAFMREAIDAQRVHLKATLSPGRHMCTTGVCVTENAGVPLYSDDGHASLSSSGYFADIIAQELGQETEGKY